MNIKRKLLRLLKIKIDAHITLISDMGLGKTFVGSEKMIQLGAKVNLVVCQKSKVKDWVEHLINNYFSDIDTLDLTNKDELNEYIYFVENKPNHSVVGIINYDLVFRRPELAELKDFTLMLDESSLIQNEMSKRSKFILRKLNPTNVILLSGTPTGGKYEKLWSQCKLLGWKISKDAFWKTYVEFHFDNKDGFPLKVIDGYKNVDRLKRKLREHVFVAINYFEWKTVKAQRTRRSVHEIRRGFRFACSN